VSFDRAGWTDEDVFEMDFKYAFNLLVEPLTSFPITNSASNTDFTYTCIMGSFTCTVGVSDNSISAKRTENSRLLENSVAYFDIDVCREKEFTHLKQNINIMNTDSIITRCLRDSFSN
jgi:hypothetical protein